MLKAADMLQDRGQRLLGEVLAIGLLELEPGQPIIQQRGVEFNDFAPSGFARPKLQTIQ
jgi:hypothetical protein